MYHYRRLLVYNSFNTYLKVLFFLLVVSPHLYSQDAGEGFTLNKILSAREQRDRAKDRASFFVPDSRTGVFPTQATLFNDIDFSSYELVNVNLSFADKNAVQKIVFAPFRMFSTLYDNTYLLNGIRGNISFKDNITTLGANIGQDNSWRGSNRARKLLLRYFDNNPQLKAQIAIISASKTASERATETANYIEMLKQVTLSYHEARVSHIFKWSVSLNQQFFSVLSSRNNTPAIDSANYYPTKATIFSPSVTYSTNNNDINISITYNRLWSRLTAKQGQDKIPYNGFSVSFNKRLFTIGDMASIKQMDMYKKFLFVPAVHVGVSYESKTSVGSIIFSEDGLRERIVWTPFLDVYISPSSQFRLTFPITHFKRPNSETGIITGIGVQYGFKIINLSE